MTNNHLTCPCPTPPCLCLEDAEAFAYEAGLDRYVACIACGHKVYGGVLLRCPECGCAMELRWSRARPGEVA